MNVRVSLLAGVLFAGAAFAGAAGAVITAPSRALDVVRSRLTACALPGLRCAPLGTFLHQRTVGPPPDRAFGPYNPDLLVSSAWIDLRDGPYRLALPAFGRRFFAIQIRDDRDDLVTLASARTVGRDGKTLVIDAADRPSADQAAVRITTPYAWVVASIEVDGEADIAAVTELQNALRLTR